jgi:hypothetical protein
MNFTVAVTSRYCADTHIHINDTSSNAGGKFLCFEFQNDYITG